MRAWKRRQFRLYIRAIVRGAKQPYLSWGSLAAPEDGESATT
jgi:hypothetical protein